MMINLLTNNGYIVLNKTLMKKIGLHEAILIGELSSEYVYWQKNDKLEDGYFYSTRENLEEQTMLSAHQQRVALNNLTKYGILEIKKVGMPSKNWYSIKEEGLLNILENKGDFISILANSNYIVVNKTIMKLLGLHEAIILGELSAQYLHWKEENKLKEGYFYSTRENIEEQTMLSAHQQRIAIENLKDIHIIEVVQKGMPLRNWYFLKEDKIYKILTEKLDISSSEKIEQQDVKKLNNKSLKNLTTCCEKNEPHDVKKLKTNNNKNKIDRLYNYFINKEKQIPKEFENYESQIAETLNKYEFLYTDGIMNYMSEENKAKVKIISYAISMLIKENTNNLLYRMNREQIISLYDECKIREQDYKDTPKEIVSFPDYFYRSLKNQILRVRTPYFFDLKIEDEEGEEI